MLDKSAVLARQDILAGTAIGWVGHLCDEHLFEVSLSTMIFFRRRNYAPLTQAFTGNATSQAR